MNKKANRLINSKSPYLKQHAYDPINWYPWGEEAFEEAKRRNVPIFLSIGYSTCHWCHVMQKESFQDEEIAKILNENFVAIKVDREERPDVDEFYMNICQIVSRSCGWPLNLFLTPNREPFLVFTYLPKESMMGVVGFKDLLIRVSDLWKNNRGEALIMATNIMNAYNELLAPHPSPIDPESLINGSYVGMLTYYDPHFGGFGSAPKFPQAQKIVLLTRYYRRSGKKRALDMVEKSLEMMRMGGVYDQVGYGFHRYSTDKEWKLPHFEKMLYDQAMISKAYLEAYSLTKNKFYLDVAEEIFEYVARDLTSSMGGFYSAEDAESEGVEGKFYTWTYEELKNGFGDEFAKAKKLFNLEKDGNYFDEATRVKTGRNILYIGKSLDTIVKELGLESRDEAYEYIKRLARKLFPLRELRVRPKRDEKILADWNGLMITSLALGYRLSGKKKYLELAERAIEFIMGEMFVDGELYHSYIDGELTAKGFLEDYVFLADALLELYWSTYKIEYLEKSKMLIEKAIEVFWDEEKGFLLKNPSEKDLPRSVRRTYESSIPPGNIYASYVLTKLGFLLGRSDYLDLARKSLELVGEDIVAFPDQFPSAIITLDLLSTDKIREVVVVAKEDEIESVKKILINNYNPYVFPLIKYSEIAEKLTEIAPYTRTMNIVEDKTTIYICKNNICELPTNNIEVLKELYQ